MNLEGMANMDFTKMISWLIRVIRLLIQLLFGLTIISILVVVFAKLAEDVWFQEGFIWDAPIILALHQLGIPTLDAFMRFVTQSGETGSILIAVGLAAWFTWKKRHVEAISVLIAFGGAVVINSLLKLLFARPRPHLFTPLVVESGFSFPSGHVTASVAAYGFLAVVLWQNKRYGWALLSAVWVLLVAASRIYLGVHYPSDTIAAIASAGSWLVVVLYIQLGYLKLMKQASP